MFQTFSGSSRRPRQVNLSGHNPNPFAVNAWGAASATQQTVASAHQERQQRQLDRERLNASKQIQRIWRGYKVRSDLANSQRRCWDELEAATNSSEYATLVEQLRFLVLFYSPSQQQDHRRLLSLSHRIQSLGFSNFLASDQIQKKLPKFAQISLGALQASLPECSFVLLNLLVSIVREQPLAFPPISQEYYTYISSLLSSDATIKPDRKSLITAIGMPLLQHADTGNSIDQLCDAYANFSLYFLTTPDLSSLLSGLGDIATVIDLRLLSTAIAQYFAISRVEKIQPENKLWLLANFIALRRLQQRRTQDPEFVKALSLQLSSSSAEIKGRMDTEDGPHINEDERDGISLPALPKFIKIQLLTLVNKESISEILEKFNLDHLKVSAAVGEEYASLIASYALTLLRIFPRRGDELRMWLHLGSITSPTGAQVPALKFFWNAVSKSNVFNQIKVDSKAALTLLREQSHNSPRKLSLADMAKDREWRTILLFIELYTFVLRFTDDEEFFSPGRISMTGEQGPISRNRDSALPLEDVKQLTIFLKNLAFTTHYNAGELSDDIRQTVSGGLGSYFGAAPTSRFRSPEPINQSESIIQRPFAGIAGMNFEYVRSVASGVMRMLYERDSRRRFLPKDHWLMTSRFEMEGFIPAVVMEEEKSHEVPDDDEEVDGDLVVDDVFMHGHDRSRIIGMGRGQRTQQIEALRKTQQQAARQKILASVGPRLEVLQNMPFVIPFETRVQIFRQFVLLDQVRRREGNVDADHWRMAIMQRARSRDGHELLGRHHAKIRRDQIFEDAFEQFYGLGDGLKEPIQITFVDQFDTVEAGIDGGGVTKEFLTSVTKEAFQTGESSLFVTNDQNLLYPNPTALDERRVLLKEAGLHESDYEWKDAVRDLLNHYEFLGRIVGKCLYEGILVDIGFAAFFLLKWAASGTAGETSYKSNINDLRDLDESLYQGLLQVKNYAGNVEDLALDFTITDTVSITGSPTIAITRDLMPNGSNIPVTNENRPLYVSYVARHRLQKQPHLQTQAFLRGLGTIIKPSWLSMFNQSELQTLIGGDSSEIDISDLRANTLYGGVYVIGDDGQEHDTVKLFWQVMTELDDADRRKVLKYVTSTPRAPLLGFGMLNPRFSIRDGGGDETRLPSTSTCVNLLKLPRYTNKRVLRDKLLYAVNSGAGFDLS